MMTQPAPEALMPEFLVMELRDQVNNLTGQVSITGAVNRQLGVKVSALEAEIKRLRRICRIEGDVDPDKEYHWEKLSDEEFVREYGPDDASGPAKQQDQDDHEQHDEQDAAARVDAIG